MRFVLHYRGRLQSNGDAREKHNLRRHFHSQLAILWSQRPLAERPEFLSASAKEGAYCLRRPRGAFVFVPLVNAMMDAVAELRVIMLRPEPPGGLLQGSGDIDNRLKTLFDALSMPPQDNALPRGAVPEEGETPFFCLLEDDSLVTAVAVQVDQLLEPTTKRNFVDLRIDVVTRVTRPTIGNSVLA